MRDCDATPIIEVEVNFSIRMLRVHGSPGCIEMETRVWVKVMDDFPNIENHVSLSPSFQAVDFKFLKSLPSQKINNSVLILH